MEYARAPQELGLFQRVNGQFFRPCFRGPQVNDVLQGKCAATRCLPEDPLEAGRLTRIEAPDSGFFFLELVTGVDQNRSVAAATEERCQGASDAAGVGQNQPETGFGVASDFRRCLERLWLPLELIKPILDRGGGSLVLMLLDQEIDDLGQRF